MKIADLVSSFKRDEKQALEGFYNAQKENFIKWASHRFDTDRDNLLDVYQDAVIVLYTNALDGKLDDVQSSPEAYLFGIARNLLLKKTEKGKRVDYQEEINEEQINNLDLSLYRKFDEDHNKKILAEAFEKLKEGCKQILTMYYFNKFRMDVIKDRLGYDNTDVVKSRKHQCMKSLQKIMQKA